jgi:hypothetical protein
MADTVIFGGNNSLDFVEVRAGVLRIPEVSLKIEEAQSLWDKECKTSFSFQHFLSSDDHSFYNNINLKSLSQAIVQLGLFDRYERLFKKPDYLVGNIEGDSALKVAAGQLTFRELISKSLACSVLRPMLPLHTATDLVLRGQNLPKFKAYASAEPSEGVTRFEELFETDINLQNLVKKLIEEKGVKRIVHIGPGTIEKTKLVDEFYSSDVQIVESIDVDPMLGWFWANLRKQEASALAL